MHKDNKKSQTSMVPVPDERQWEEAIHLSISTIIIWTIEMYYTKCCNSTTYYNVKSYIFSRPDD